MSTLDTMSTIGDLTNEVYGWIAHAEGADSKATGYASSANAWPGQDNCLTTEQSVAVVRKYFQKHMKVIDVQSIKGDEPDSYFVHVNTYKNKWDKIFKKENSSSTWEVKKSAGGIFDQHHVDGDYPVVIKNRGFNPMNSDSRYIIDTSSDGPVFDKIKSCLKWGMDNWVEFM